MDNLRENDGHSMASMMKDLQRLRKEDKLGLKKNGGGNKSNNAASNSGSNNLNGAANNNRP
jgi:hypothetical protein